MSHARRTSRHALGGPRLWAAVTLALLVMCGLILSLGGWNEDTLRRMIGATARSSLGLFLFAFVASSLRRRWQHPFTAWLLRNRRAVGLSFATSHYLHLAAILALALAFPTFRAELNWVTLVFGGVVGYGLITAMALTSNDAAVAWLGRERWRRLHAVGSYYLWFIFFQSTAGASLVHSPAYLVPSLLLLGALALRLVPVGRAERVAA